MLPCIFSVVLMCALVLNSSINHSRYNEFMLEFNFEKHANCWNLLKFLLGQTSFCCCYCISSFLSLFSFLSIFPYPSFPKLCSHHLEQPYPDSAFSIRLFLRFLDSKIIPKNFLWSLLYLSPCSFFLLKRNATFFFIKITPSYILRTIYLKSSFLHFD
jgi:hypothetical protein